MCQYTRKHKCREPQYEVTRNGKPRIYCDEAIEQAVANGGVVIVERHLTPREPDSLKAGASCLPDVVKSENNLPAWLLVKNYLWSAKVFLQLWFYLKFHYIEDFEASLIRSGCRVVVSQSFKTYHFPRGGKVIIEGDVVELIPANAT